MRYASLLFIVFLFLLTSCDRKPIFKNNDGWLYTIKCEGIEPQTGKNIIVTTGKVIIIQFQEQNATERTGLIMGYNKCTIT